MADDKCPACGGQFAYDVDDWPYCPACSAKRQWPHTRRSLIFAAVIFGVGAFAYGAKGKVWDAVLLAVMAAGFAGLARAGAPIPS